jgi:2-polyprenyl-3-methyl-5-hydroxy-6-metoxy-1,4-benzoquinol methylase
LSPLGPSFGRRGQAGIRPGAKTVLDLAAGTGKLSRPLVARGLAVTAVDPLEGMLAKLRAFLPGVPR